MNPAAPTTSPWITKEGLSCTTPVLAPYPFTKSVVPDITLAQRQDETVRALERELAKP